MGKRAPPYKLVKRRNPVRYRRRIGFCAPGNEPELIKVAPYGEYEGTVSGDGIKQDEDE